MTFQEFIDYAEQNPDLTVVVENLSGRSPLGWKYHYHFRRSVYDSNWRYQGNLQEKTFAKLLRVGALRLDRAGGGVQKFKPVFERE